MSDGSDSGRSARRPAVPRARLFIGLAPDTRAAAELDAYLRPLQAWPMRWIAPRNRHLTLHFLGAVGHHDLCRLEALLPEWVGATGGLVLSLERPLYLPNRRQPRVLALGAAPRAPLLELHERLGGMLRRLGLPTEARRFRPHLSLARVPPGLRPPLLPDLAAAIHWPVREVLLYQSRTLPGGAEYEIRLRAPLRG